MEAGRRVLAPALHCKHPDLALGLTLQRASPSKESLSAWSANLRASRRCQTVARQAGLLYCHIRWEVAEGRAEFTFDFCQIYQSRRCLCFR